MMTAEDEDVEMRSMMRSMMMGSQIPFSPHIKARVAMVALRRIVALQDAVPYHHRIPRNTRLEIPVYWLRPTETPEDTPHICTNTEDGILKRRELQRTIVPRLLTCFAEHCVEYMWEMTLFHIVMAVLERETFGMDEESFIEFFKCILDKFDRVPRAPYNSTNRQTIDRDDFSFFREVIQDRQTKSPGPMMSPELHDVIVHAIERFVEAEWVLEENGDVMHQLKKV